MRTLSSDDLVAADVPAEGASLSELKAFAHTFNGYERWGSFQQCADIANARDHSSLDSLRTCLFFEVRRWHHYARDPDSKAVAYWRLLAAEIRGQLQTQNR